MRLAPFLSLSYNTDVAGPPRETSAPPYGQVDPEMFARHRTANPYTVMELIAAESTAGESTAGPGFARARGTLERWRRTQVLVTDRNPALYLYEQHELRRGVPAVQRGLVSTIELADIADGTLLLHEDIEVQRAALRARRMRQVPVDLTPVVAIHLGGGAAAMDHMVARAHRHAPVAALTDEEQVDHRIWRVEDQDTIHAVTTGFADVTAVLADGHHRVAAALRINDEMHARGLQPGPWGRTTVMVVDASIEGPELRPIHRLVEGMPPIDHQGRPDLPGFRALEWSDATPALERAIAQMPGLCFGLVTKNGSWVLRANDPTRLRRGAAAAGSPLRELDAQVMTTAVLPVLTHSSSSGTDSGLQVQSVTDVDHAVKALSGPGGGTLVLLAPPRPQQVLDVARAGLRMPAKTTWFRPKPRAGLIMRALDTDGHGDLGRRDDRWQRQVR